MIGTLTGLTWKASLNDDGSWECDNDVVNMCLETNFSRDDYSEAHGIFGRRMLTMAGEYFEAKVEFAKPLPEDGYYQK